MIFARITLKGEFRFHGSGEVTGSPADDNYRMGGWFPVDQFDFGFNDSDSKDKQQQQTGQPPTGRPGAPAAVKNQPPNPAKQDGQKDAFSSMQLSKTVDRASCELMVLAMQERSQKKGPNKDSEYHADIHVVGSVHYKETDETDRYIYPSLMIHLEGVHVTQWKISGSGDSRPTESVTLRYDKAAMHYLWTNDGAVFLPIGPKGWDQTKNKQWPENDGDIADSVFKMFLPKM